MSITKYYNLIKFKMFPICRSITGGGIRKTLKIIKNEFPKLRIYSFKTGTKVFDWKIPYEWNIKKAYILDRNKKKIVDFSENSLHLVNYSIPVNKIISKKKLLSRLYTIKKLPTAIPYVTSYYKKYWGFCCSYLKKKKIEKNYNNEDKFKIIIDSSFKSNGKLNYGEYVIFGQSKQEILISTYVCHPSMANNELSGPAVAMLLINFFQKKKLNKTLRFIFIPETIGSIAFISKNLIDLKKNVIGGYNLSCIGDERMHSCLLTKYKNTIADQSLLEAYKKLNIKPKIYNFLKRGSDERQYNSPGIDLPVASIFRSKYGEYPEYHTSLDNFDLVTKDGLKGGFLVAKTAIEILLKKTIPKVKILCEPHMSKRNLYPTISFNNRSQMIKNIMNFLQYADGKNDLKKIAKQIHISIHLVKKINKLLLKKKLIQI
jgi:aminopeptidase-like protein